jgi:RimK family alpha-L-glutamate ligase
MLRAVRASSGVVAVVAWRHVRTNAPLVKAWRELGIRAALLDPSRAHEILGPGDVALARADVSSSLDGVERGLLEIAALRRRGVRVLNGPEELIAAHDKLQTAQRLQHAGVPHPRTIHLVDLDDVAALEVPFVLKPRFGSWGHDVMLCRRVADVKLAVTELRERCWWRDQGVLAQELVAPRGHDVRLIVASGRVVGAVERRAAPGEWRTNISYGARLVSVAPSCEACELAVGASRAIGGDLIGIDLLPLADGGYVVLEANGAVDFGAEYSLPAGDVYRDAADALGLTTQAAAAAGDAV